MPQETRQNTGEKPTRKAGQPRKYGTEKTVVLAVTAPESLISDLDAAVADRRRSGHACSRSSLVVELLRDGLRVPVSGPIG